MTLSDGSIPLDHISTVAGNYALGTGYSGDGGPATAARLNLPAGLAFDSGGNLYIADSGNHVARKVDSNQNISTVAGQCPPAGCAGGFSGDTGLATDALPKIPMGVAVDQAGNLGTGHLAAVDYCATCGDPAPAMIVKSGLGKYVGPLTIDTYLRSYSNSTTGSTLSGAMVIPFVVAN